MKSFRTVCAIAALLAFEAKATLRNAADNAFYSACMAATPSMTA